mgnify:CR=1 FL=1
MEVKNAFAGTLESGDILVQITPSEEESLQIDLDSTVEYQFGGQIRKVIKETLENLGVKKAHVKATVRASPLPQSEPRARMSGRISPRPRILGIYTNGSLNRTK